VAVVSETLCIMH